jgi:hypothetical protein
MRTKLVVLLAAFALASPAVILAAGSSTGNSSSGGSSSGSGGGSGGGSHGSSGGGASHGFGGGHAILGHGTALGASSSLHGERAGTSAHVAPTLGPAARSARTAERLQVASVTSAGHHHHRHYRLRGANYDACASRSGYPCINMIPDTLCLDWIDSAGRVRLECPHPTKLMIGRP